MREALIEAMQAEAQQRLALVEVPGARSGRAGEALGEAVSLQAALTDAQEAALPAVSMMTEASARHAMALGEVASALTMADSGQERFTEALGRAGIVADTMNDTLVLTQAAARQIGGASARHALDALASNLQRILMQQFATLPLNDVISGRRTCLHLAGSMQMV